jgi:hypothetical protein
MHRPMRLASLVVLASLLVLITALQYEPVEGTPITSGPAYDDAAVLAVSDQRLIVIFERRQQSQEDLYVTTSEDDGASWSEPAPVRAADSDDRLGSVVRLADGTFLLFYTSAPTPGGMYSIHRASSPDGVTWTSHGAIDLNQTPYSPANPDVVLEADGRLTMVYELLGGGGIFVAQSADGGVTWDPDTTQITPVEAMAPRIAHTSEGGYVLTYHIGGAKRNVFAKYATDPYAMGTAIANPIAVDSDVGIDSFDALPLLLNDGTMAIFYAQSWDEAPPDLYYRASDTGFWWQAPREVTDNTVGELMPFAVPGGSPRSVDLTWIQATTPNIDYDVYFHRDLEIAPLPTPTTMPGPPTGTPTATVWLSPTASPTATLTPSQTVAPTYTPPPTRTLTPTPMTPSATPTTSPTPTLTPNPTGTATLVPHLTLIPGEYPSSVAPGDLVTVTWTVETNRGANTWIEWGTEPGVYAQRHDFPWAAGGIYEYSYGITAPNASDLYFRVVADDDVHEPATWLGHVIIQTVGVTPTATANSTPAATPTVGPMPSLQPAMYLPYVGR